MEVRFRPLPPSTLARTIPGGQSSSGDGESFLEIVESVTGSEQSPEENPNSGRNRERPISARAWLGSGPVEDDVEPEQAEQPPAQQATPKPSSEKKSDNENPVGGRIDFTA